MAQRGLTLDLYGTTNVPNPEQNIESVNRSQTLASSNKTNSIYFLPMISNNAT